MSSGKSHILLVGFGNMGRALAEGWIESESVAAKISVVDPSAEAREQAAKLGIEAFADPSGIEAHIDIAVLAVKPGMIDELIGSLPTADLYLSIAAGRSIGEISGLLGVQAAIVRAMPNTPAAIGQGVTGMCANQAVSAEQRSLAGSLMNAVGTVEWLADESDMDALTAVSGSGPAYVFLLIETLAAAAVDVGLEPGLARRLATETVRGAGAYAATTGIDPEVLRQQVTSPGGTTEAAMRVLLEADGLRGLMLKAVRAAKERSRALGSK